MSVIWRTNTILDQFNRPLAGVRVTVLDDGGALVDLPTGNPIVTNFQGVWEASLPAGDYLLQFRKGNSFQESAITVPEAIEGADGETVTGALYDDDGRAIVGALLVAYDATGAEVGTATTNYAGAWSVDLPAGDLTLIISVGRRCIVRKVTVFGVAPDRVATPVISPDSGTVPAHQEITITCATSGATIFYTTDGTTPTESSTEYTGPFDLPDAPAVYGTLWDSTGTTTTSYEQFLYSALRASPAIPNDRNSYVEVWSPGIETSSGNRLQIGIVREDVISTPGDLPTPLGLGTHQYVTQIPNPDDTGIYCYNASPNIPTGSGKTTELARVGLCINPTAGTISLVWKNSGGTYTFYPDVWTGLDFTTYDYYLAFGGSSASTSTRVAGAFATNPADMEQLTVAQANGFEAWYTEAAGIEATVKAIAVKVGLSDSLVATEVYEIAGAVATPVISPGGGTVAPETEITITCATSGADIYWTDDGSTPTSSDNLYTGPFDLPDSGSVTIKAIGIKSGYSDSAVASEDYEIVDCAAGIFIDTGTNVAANVGGATPSLNNIQGTNIVLSATQKGYLEFVWNGTAAGKNAVNIGFVKAGGITNGNHGAHVGASVGDFFGYFGYPTFYTYKEGTYTGYGSGPAAGVRVQVNWDPVLGTISFYTAGGILATMNVTPATTYTLCVGAGTDTGNSGNNDIWATIYTEPDDFTLTPTTGWTYDDHICGT